MAVAVSTRPDIVFQQSIFGRDKLVRGGRQFERLISSGEQLGAAFEKAQAHPMWKRDPRLGKIPREVADEVLALYNAVIADGRHIRDFVHDPRKAAEALKIELSDRAFETIRVVGSNLGNAENPAGAIAVISISVVAIAVTTAIVSSAADPRSRIVIDESGIVKV
jgi:hypothetical protein